MTKDKATGSNIGCTTILGIVFITLKLCHIIDWSWLWVLAPFWIPVSLVICIGLIVAFFQS
jgi:hypothetical protein